MESGYRIGRVKDAQWMTNSNGRIILEYQEDRNSHYDHDLGSFNNYLSRKLGDPFQDNGFPDFGCTWIVDNRTLNGIIAEYNSTNPDKDDLWKHPMFTDLVGRLEDGDYYVVWVDWS